MLSYFQLSVYLYCYTSCTLISGFCHFGLVSFMGFVTEQTPVMSCFYVNTWLRVYSSRALSCLRALFRVGAWCSDPALLTWVSVSLGSDTHAPFSVSLCERAGLELARLRALLFTCVLCVCTQFMFYRLCTFMLCLMLCGTQLVIFIGCVLSCCHVLYEHVAYEYYH